MERTTPASTLDLSNVLGSATDLVRARFGHYARLAMLAAGLSLSVTALTSLVFAAASSLGVEIPDRVRTYIALIALAVQLSLPSIAFVAAAHSALMSHRGKSLRVRAAVARSIGRAHLFVAVGLVSALVVWVGLVACVVPGLLAVSTLALSGVVIVVERAGPIEAMRRSAALTSGGRLTVFLALVVVCCLAAVLLFLGYLGFGCLLTAVLLSSERDASIAMLLIMVPYYLLSSLVSAGFGMWIQAVLVAIYVHCAQVPGKNEDWVQTFA